jgi:hypothetical protein
MGGRWNESTFEEIRRRLSWVLELREFDRPFDWKALPAARELTRIAAMPRFDAGMILCSVSAPTPPSVSWPSTSGLRLSGIKAATWPSPSTACWLTPSIGGRGGGASKGARTLRRFLADIVHQYERIRLPRRGLQALLLGLWAAGHRLRIDVATDGDREGHEAFFNDFPSSRWPSAWRNRTRPGAS